MFDSYTSAGKLYKKVVSGFIVITVIATALFYSYLTKQNSRKSNAAPGIFASLVAVPPSNTMQDNVEYTTSFQFDTSYQPMVVQGYDMNIAFDNSLITITHISYNLGQVSQGLGDTDNDIAQVNSRGTIFINGEIPSTSPPILTQGTPVVTISYKTKLPRTTNDFSTLLTTTGNFTQLHADNTLTMVPMTQMQVPLQTEGFTPPPGSPTPISGTGTPAPTTTCTPPPACYINGTCDIAVSPDWCPIGNTIINMKLRFQGITQAPAVTAPMTTHIRIISAVTNRVFDRTVDFSSDANGIWSGSTTVNLDPTLDPVGTLYSIYVKGPRHLKKRICTVKPVENIPGTYACATDGINLSIGTNTIDASGIYQLAGDLPVDNGQQNGLIDSEDTSYIRLHFGDTSPAALQVADLNMDGAITTQDFSLVIAALGVKYDDPEESINSPNIGQ